MPRRSPQTLAVHDDTIQVSIPRAALTIVEAPRTVSQRSSERVLGVPSSVYLASLRAYQRDGGEVMTLGRLRLVEVDAYVRWLGRSSAAAPTTPAPATRDAVDDLARELGLGGR